MHLCVHACVFILCVCLGSGGGGCSKIFLFPLLH